MCHKVVIEKKTDNMLIIVQDKPQQIKWNEQTRNKRMLTVNVLYDTHTLVVTFMPSSIFQ